MNSNDLNKIEAIKRKYKETATVARRSRLAEFADGIRESGHLAGLVGAVFLGAIFLTVGINFLKVPVNYIFSGEKINATIIDFKKRKHFGDSRQVYIPVVEFFHNGKRRIASMKSTYSDMSEVYRGKQVVVRYLEDSPEIVISEWPVKPISSGSIFALFGIGLIFLIVKYGRDNGEGFSALPGDDYTAPIDSALTDINPSEPLVFIREPSTTARIVMLLIALAIAIASGLYIYSVSDRVADTWRIIVTIGFFAFFVVGILLLAVRRHKTIIDLITRRIEQHKGFFTYQGKKSWPISQFQSIEVDTRAHYSDSTNRKTVKYYLRMKGRQNLTVLVDTFVDGITAAFYAKKLSKLTGIPTSLGGR